MGKKNIIFNSFYFLPLKTFYVKYFSKIMLNFFIVYQVENAKNNKVLEQFLSQATIMVVSVTASTTQGGNLNDDELTIVKESADVALALNDYKKKIFEYVESRMAFIAPNLSIIVGASTAAKLVS